VSEPATPEQSFRKGLYSLAQREGLWRTDLQELFREGEAKVLLKPWHMSADWDNDTLRRHARDRLLDLRDQIKRDEEAKEKWLRPSKVPNFVQAYDATFNLGLKRNMQNLEVRQEKVNLKDTRGRQFKYAIVTELINLIVGPSEIKLVEQVDSSESVTLNDSAEDISPQKPTESIEVEQPAEEQREADDVVDENDNTPEIPKKSVTIPRPVVYTAAAMLLVMLALVLFFVIRDATATTTPLTGSSLSARNIAPGASSEQPDTGTDQDLIFDDLGAGFNTILVYPGTSESDADKRQNAIYTNGETKRATCKEEGRMAHTNTAKGEPDRSSNHWFKIVGIPGQNEYARAIYTKNADELWAKLPYCVP
jgi:hypothetical protein